MYHQSDPSVKITEKITLPVPDSQDSLLSHLTSSSRKRLVIFHMRKRDISLAIFIASAAFIAKQRWADHKKIAKYSADPKGNENTAKAERKVSVNKEFFQQLKYILRICIPHWKTRTAGIIGLHTVFLILRTYLSVVVARIDGKLVKDLVILTQ